jgi:serine/threonine-protein kinase RsbT
VVDEVVTVRVDSDADIVSARQAGRAMADMVGFSSTDATLIATAISELARNMLTYAGGGELRLTTLEERRRRGIEVVAADRGPGITDVARAMEDGYSTGRGMGLGLPGARRLVDEFLIDAPLGVGTTVTVRKWRARRDG